MPEPNPKPVRPTPPETSTTVVSPVIVELVNLIGAPFVAAGFTVAHSNLAASNLEHSVEVSHPIGTYVRIPLYSHVHQRVTCSTIHANQRPPHREGAKNGDHGGQSGGNGCGGGGGIGVGNRFSPSQYFAGALVRTSQSNQ
jgi:hypothetical protein